MNDGLRNVYRVPKVSYQTTNTCTCRVRVSASALISPFETASQFMHHPVCRCSAICKESKVWLIASLRAVIYHYVVVGVCVPSLLHFVSMRRWGLAADAKSGT